MRSPATTSTTFVDDFTDVARRGRVIGSATRGARTRHGADPEGVLSIEQGGLRIRPLVAPGWNRAAIRYGRFEVDSGMVLSAVVCTGRNASTNARPWPSWHAWLAQWVRGTQCYPPPLRLVRSLRFPRRDTVRRRIATARHDAVLPPTERNAFGLAFGWVDDPERPLDGIVLATRATPTASSELVLAVGGEVTTLGPLLELPMRLALGVVDDNVVAMATIDDGLTDGTTLRVLARRPLPFALGAQWASIEQRVVGEVGFAADTRVREVRLDRLEPAALRAALPSSSGPDDHDAGASGGHRDGGTALTIASSATPIVAPPVDLLAAPPGELRVVFTDEFAPADRPADPAPVDLEGRRVDGRTWRRLAGDRTMLLDPSGGVRVGPERPAPTSKLARLFLPTGQRTVYGVEWDGGPGFVEATITAPTAEDLDDARGRGGVVLYQDDDNYLMVNDWIDTAHAPSVSVFWRTAGFEDVYDGLWAIVDDRLTWGRPHRLGVRFDDEAFAVYLDGVAVIGREYCQLYPAARPLTVRHVGICGNWDFGDDTGSHFADFRAAAVTASP